MTDYPVFAIGFATADPDVIAGPDGLGTLGNITVPDGEAAAIIATVGDLLGLTFENLTLYPGDRVIVTGAMSAGLPQYQVGMEFIANDDGVAYFANAGHLAAAISEARSA